ncbi:MAG: glycosyltransferase family 2 protein [Candidatus Firestonebacteria bacterium]|nr:glycosyltransferase family 2 protein [Candidatus Firestonebacteria bacterium]
MIDGKRIAVVLPAYNADKTLKATYAEIPKSVVDEIILVDDHSQDATAQLAKSLKIETYIHEKNQGYGANQKTCYRAVLAKNIDVVVMLHPDYQYTPKLLRAMCSLIADEVYDMVIGSRILSGGALRGGMPLYKYISNRFITFLENVFLGAKLSEYHTGYRAYHRRVLEKIPFEKFSNDFIFDNQFLIAAIQEGFSIGEVSCPTKYFREASSINFKRSLKYGLLCLWYALVGGLKHLPRRLQNARRILTGK